MGELLSAACKNQSGGMNVWDLYNVFYQTQLQIVLHQFEYMYCPLNRKIYLIVSHLLT